MPSAKPHKNRASLNLAMGLLGLVTLVAALVAAAFDASTVVTVPLVLTLMGSLIVIYATRKSDEYTLALWSAGANAAFLVIVLFALFAPFFEGVYDGFMGAHDGSSSDLDFPAEAASIGAILVFYTVFNAKRLTGAF